LDWSQEKIGVAIGIDESSSRARISRYDLGVQEPPLPTARLIAHARGAPLSYLYCGGDKMAALLLALPQMKPVARYRKVADLCILQKGSLPQNTQIRLLSIPTPVAQIE